MRGVVFSAIAAAAYSQTIISTTNECWKGEGGKYNGECYDVYFLTCDEYQVDADSACNVYTMSDSRVTWVTNELTVHFWELYQDETVEGWENIEVDDLKGGSPKCYKLVDTPTEYKNRKIMNYTDGMCGFQYQITNNNVDFHNYFEIHKDSALTLVAGSTLSLLAVLSF